MGSRDYSVNDFGYVFNMNGLEMVMDIRFNRKLTKADYVVPGGYEMVFGGRRRSLKKLRLFWCKKPLYFESVKTK